MQPAHLSVCLLNDEFAGIVEGNSYVEPVAYTPLPVFVGGKGSLYGCTQIAVGAFERAQTVFVGIKPQRSLVVGSTELHLHLVLEAVERLPAVSTRWTVLRRSNSGSKHSKKSSFETFHQ